MNLLIMIVAAVAVAFLIAVLVVKFLPLKLRPVVSIVLLVLAVFLVYKIYNGVMAPINFDKKKVKVYSEVIENLKLIRDAEVAYYEVNGTYTKDKKALIQFIDTAKYAITETKTVVEKVNRGGGIIEDVERRVIDTTGYEPVLRDFKNKDYKNMFKVPTLSGKEFELEVGKVEKVQGLEVPVFQARIDKESVLKGEDPSLIKIEKEAVQSDEVKGPYISVGSLNEVTTGGNWPPSYDKNDRAKKNQ